MAGNIGEWVHDWFQIDLGTLPQVDPAGPATGLYKVVRSGLFFDETQMMRSAFRSLRPPAGVVETMGVRCVRSLP